MPDPRGATVVSASITTLKEEAMKLKTLKLTALTADAVMTLSAASVDQARHGADDPAGHKRGADDVQSLFKHGAYAAARYQCGSNDLKPHFKRGADDRGGSKH